MESAFTPHQALEESIAKIGSQAKLGALCEVSQAAVWKWVHEARRLPAEHVLTVEAATGVSRHDLRPDIYPREEPPAHLPAEDPRSSSPAGGPPSDALEGARR